MKEQILKVARDLEQDSISEIEARNLLLAIFGISHSVFIVCENDDYGRDLYLECKDTLHEAEQVKGKDPTRHIYEHEIVETLQVICLEERVKVSLLNRGFSVNQLLNNRGLISATIEETESITRTELYE